MNFEYLQFHSTNTQEILDRDWTKIDLLILNVTLINDYYYLISPETLKKLRTLDQSKIILTIDCDIREKPKAELDKVYICAKDWPVPMMRLHTNYVINKYNFIYTDNFEIITKLYQEDKITVLLSCYDQILDKLHNFSPQLSSYVHILIVATTGYWGRGLSSQYGIPKVSSWDPMVLSKRPKHCQFRLEGKAITLHEI